ncbi:HEAT repeat-containing protein 1 [Scleropages formosus]|uniref:HEAT repeat-containing protein 1 n=1 Tax=Scleropages formosus TaxID=113540 RepID=UPI0010FACB85|nr:HEAT repeat-containing protein 1 [Scleropages formosus]XP_018616677.2 HEAT repeat-containing protein 1 [Scleropages formosus]
MTSLAHQLKRLALPQNDPSLLSRKDVASLLFDPKEAASIDRDTFFALGCTGLEELLGIESAFEEFQETLFSQASKGLERSVQTKEVNQKLDASISLFLTRLSPYFLLKPAQKCIEWLIHRFHIHQYNQDSLIACSLPYHETKVFVRVIQLLKIKDPTHRWNWLQCLQKPGVPLARGTLITHCYKDLGFMDFICSLVTKSVKAYSHSGENCPQLRVIFSFYASTIIPALDAVEKVTDALVAKLLPYVQKGLKSSLVDYKAATYMIVCQLAVKVVMESHLVDTLALQISKSVVKTPTLPREGLGSLIVLLQNQKAESISEKAFGYLSAIPTLVPTLKDIASVYDIGPLLRCLLPHLVRFVVTDKEPDTAETLEMTNFGGILASILQELALTNGLENTVANLFLQEYLSHGALLQTSADGISNLNQRLQPLIRTLESKYPGALDVVLEGHVSDISNKEEQNLFHQFISLSLSSGKYKIIPESDTTLLLGLNHPLPSVRNLALEHLKEILRTGQAGFDEDFLREAVLERLRDDVPEVVLAALKAMQVNSEFLSAEDMVSSLLSLFQRTDVSKAGNWFPVLKEAMRVLDNTHLLEEIPTLRNRVVTELLPFLVITCPYENLPEYQVASCVARSSLISQHPLTQGWSQALEDVMARTCPSDVMGVANQQLISTMTKNLLGMEASSKRSCLDALVDAVTAQRSSPRERTGFLVLTYTLVHGLGDLHEAQHFHIAERALDLLEPQLREVAAWNPGPEKVLQPLEELRDTPFPPSQCLEGYLSRLYTGDGGEQEKGFLLLLLLRAYIRNLSCATSTLKEETWWNPEKLDNTTCCYLRLLIRLFEMTIAGASQGPLAPGFRALMRLLFQVHLSELPELFGFLSLLWGYGWSQSDQLDHRVGAVLQTQALYVGRALLSSQNGKNLKLLTSATSPVVPSLLMCLGSPVREVRRAAVAALQELGGADASPFHLVTKKLLQETEELITDPSHVSQALGKMYEEAIAGKGKAQDKKMIASVDQLLGCVQSPDCPSYTARALLQLLREVNGEAVLEVLLPAMERLLDQSGPDGPTFLKDEALLLQFLLTKYNEQSAPLLARHKGSLECFIRATGTLLEPFPGMPSFQLVALEQITKPFFAALGDEKVQQRLLAVMFDLLVDCKNPVCAQTINGVFKSITVDGELVAAEFGPVDRPKVSGSVHQTRRSKMLHRKAQDSASGPPDGISAVPWQRVTLILELLQHKKKLKRPQKLVPTLFSLLSRSLEPVQDDVTNLEYTKQLILSCLLNVCYKLSPDGALISKDVLEEEKFNVELVVQCLRGSGMPQTHHHALLLLGTMARIFPEKVLHNIMPIFTFMGANVMRLDDAYSFQVISKTVQMVIPALIKAYEGGPSQLPGRTESMETVVIRVVHVFVDALPHVPEHRRRPVLAGLMTTLGAGHFLWVLLLLLFKQHAMQATSADAGVDKETALQRDVEFWISVCCEFEVPEQLLSLFKILKYLSRLPEDKEDDADKAKTRHRGTEKEGTDTLLFNVEMHSGKELRHYKFLSLSFLSQLLASDGFVGKVADCDLESQNHLQSLQQSLLEEILCYINSVARCVEANANKPTAKFWRAMLNKSYDVLDKVIALLPTDTFITVMRGLMANKLPSVRRKAMELLNNKLQQKTVWNNDQVCVLLNLTKDLLSIVSRGQHEDDEEEEEQAINRQTALYSLKLLCRSFGASHQEAFVPVLHGAMELVTSPHEDRNVMGSALLCIAEVTSALKALAVPQLPRLMPAVLQTLKERKELFSNKVYLLSAVTALQRVSETLPHFISPYLKDILLQVSRLTRVVEQCTKCPQLPVRLASLRATLATKVPSRVLLPAVTMCYSQVAQSQQNRLGPLMDILKDHIVHMERDELTGHQSELTSFFLTALDFRSQHSQGNLEKANEAEGCIIHCLLAMILKMSEASFRPLFFKLFDWSKTEGAPKDRLLTFCRLADSIADKLKGLFVLFAGHLVKPFADLLNQTNVTKTDEAFFDSDDNVEKTCLLLQYVLDCLHKIFLYDTKHFVSKERADTLMAPLVDQLENTLGGVEVYHARVTEHLVPCIAQFSIAVRDDSQWKPLNYQVLLKTRHSSPKVRFSSLLMLVELAGKLKENYMVLLPETIPFLAELMEDECEEVEHQVQKVIHEMEVILGESLQSYF